MFVRPIEFKEGAEKLQKRTVLPAPLTSAEWADIPVAIRERAFFSARVESARFLHRLHSLLGDYLEGAIETLPNGETMLKVGSKADFIRQAREFAENNGVPIPIGRAAQANIKNVLGRRRLALIFETQTRMAHGHARHRTSTFPAVVQAYPAWRFVRNPGAKVKRERHRESEGEVRLKTDIAYWANYQNAREIGGFEVPWPPFGFNSYMDTEEVSRREAEKLGLLRRGEKVKAPARADFNTKLSASTQGMSYYLRRKLRNALGGKISIAKDGTITFKPSKAKKK